MANGTVVVWGSSAAANPGMQPPSGLGLCSKIVALSGDAVTGVAALKADGTIATWGSYESDAWKTIPAGLTNVVDLVSLDSGGLAALDAAGKVWVWYEDPTNIPGSSLVAVPTGALSGVSAIYSSDSGAVGGTYIFAIKNDGSVLVWGYTSPNPTIVTNLPAGLTGVVKLLQYQNGPAMVLKANGTMTAWGNDFGSGIISGTSGLTGIVDFAVDWQGTYALAVKSDGTMVKWGTGSSSINITSITTAKKVFAGYSGGLVVDAAGKPIRWFGDVAGLPLTPTGITYAKINSTEVLTAGSSPPYKTSDISAAVPAGVNSFFSFRYNDTSIILSIADNTPPVIPPFWTDTKNTQFTTAAPTLLTKPAQTLYDPGNPGSPAQHASVSCPPRPPTKPPASDSGLHGCYVSYKFINANTAQTGAALVSVTGQIPPQYNGPGWYVSSYSIVCYP